MTKPILVGIGGSLKASVGVKDVDPSSPLSPDGDVAEGESDPPTHGSQPWGLPWRSSCACAAGDPRESVSPPLTS